jgi:S1-C subfamily serine protease
MRGWTGTVLAAVTGGGITAATLLGLGVVTPAGRTGADQATLATRGTTVVMANAPGGLAVRDIYARASPGVVCIQAQRLRPEPSPFDVDDGPADTESRGSGFVLDDEGLIVTNAHVVASATDIRVALSGDRTVSARPVGTDPDTDLALLRIDPDGLDLQPLELGDSATVRVGDPTVAIGNPLGAERTLTTGLVSALHRRLTAPSGFAVDDVIQTDAAVNPGTTGGPLLDASGRVIGISSQLGTGRGDGVVTGFAVPVNTAKEVISELEQTGRVERAYLGIHGTPAEGGVRVEHLEPGSPAALAGVGESDVLQALGGREVRSMEDVSDVLAAQTPGTVVELLVLSGDGPRGLQATLALRPAAVPAE